MKVIIDRFEGEYAVVELEDRTMVNMPRRLVPENAREGDVLNIEIDMDSTRERKERINRLMDELWE